MARKIQFSVYDSKAEYYLTPFYMDSRGEAIRGFQEVVNTPDHQFNKHPSDYTLFELGSFETTNADISFHPAPVSLGTAIEFVNPSPSQPN